MTATTGRLPSFLVDEIQRGLRGFLGRQHVDQDPTRVALDHAHVGKIETAYLVDPARHDLVEAVGHVQDRLPLQRGMDAVEVLALQQKS